MWEPYLDGVKMALPYYHHDYLAEELPTGWAASCPDDQNFCTAFIDPSAKTETNYVGQTYYFKDNEKIDRESCNSMVDPGEGCMLFQHTSEAALWSADVTYLESARLSDLKEKYVQAKVDSEQNLPHTFIVNEAKVAEKKAFPRRTLIVITSTMSAFLLTLLLLIAAESVLREQT